MSLHPSSSGLDETQLRNEIVVLERQLREGRATVRTIEQLTQYRHELEIIAGAKSGGRSRPFWHLIKPHGPSL